MHEDGKNYTIVPQLGSGYRLAVIVKVEKSELHQGLEFFNLV
jgi:hypothetical protein